MAHEGMKSREDFIPFILILARVCLKIASAIDSVPEKVNYVPWHPGKEASGHCVSASYSFVRPKFLRMR